MVILRNFQDSDTNAVLELANQFAAFDGKTSEADLAITGYFPNGFLVAEDRGSIVGFVYGYFRDIPGEVLERWGTNKVGHVALMAVEPGHRRKGVGTSLLRKLLTAFKEAGADLVLLDCPSQATDAKRLYDEAGFEVRFHGMKKRL
jgi:ribosomal protein S18 acetylase RimI-like enzyme